MITREQALTLLKKHMSQENLLRHCYSVEAVMKALARFFKEDEEKWGIVGLLHDGDYEKTKIAPEKHTLEMAEWLKEMGEVDPEILSAILSHNYAHTGQNPPKNKLEWSLYCCDELTGLIVAVTLVKPDKKLASVTVESVMNKWRQKSFAAGVKREQIEECEARLGIPLKDFIEIALTAMQGISDDLGL
ncbi:MAG: hypothetical protein UX88_C0028G0003 [Candidatus Woesebacteria bacterium GW2011_GWC2_47_16]|uniref:Phosphohydrolase n=5 Tax=Candidatus Woeseibacteriota TaxID=1752722 RepID=A0A1F8D5D6_9BACT|nr:MAG: hypothetical protein UX03_C0021G0003 [Candidatus Woesebacteria bacterium GW2011_GWE1_45_18]KKU63512.1 MAG: hypothetical protein UX88_C0028G0003 [Candidatus Woesebacteria bacterium GW2011_GWC2_47_16]OGM77029.1 MAG: phosphohydrolase [Candidatus Woesebacteria bacterium RIFOXYA1_FULL_48_16]OGM83556.1 MAG: phosphohydrolase [Candidatus Woesebacteria bacterium RIFOXYB1_FULL_47_31]OGM89532.1 MAG: phosphohydrolase [Candidatus Woesebacteria bacterium RIFOXYD1_FULL_46_19]